MEPGRSRRRHSCGGPAEALSSRSKLSQSGSTPSFPIQSSSSSCCYYSSVPGGVGGFVLVAISFHNTARHWLHNADSVKKINDLSRKMMFPFLAGIQG